MRVEFTIEGPPVGKARPRVTRTVTYTPKKTSQYENLVRYTAINSFDGCFDNDEPVDVKIVAYFPVPRSWSKKRKALCLANKELPIKMPDADNIGKIIMDGMNPKRKLNRQLKKMVEVIRGVYKDDRQVTKLLVVKRYAERPRVEVRIKRDMGEMDYHEAALDIEHKQLYIQGDVPHLGEYCFETDANYCPKCGGRLLSENATN